MRDQVRRENRGFVAYLDRPLSPVKVRLLYWCGAGTGVVVLHDGMGGGAGYTPGKGVEPCGGQLAGADDLQRLPGP